MNTNIYELYVDKFAGDLNGLAAKLPYLSLLGIDCLHLLPHFPSPMADDGYDISDYRSVRTKLGTLDDFKNLISAAHARGIRIILDFVLNHTSEMHPWFIEARSSRTNLKRDFYLWNDTPNRLNDATNAFPDIKESNWILNKETGDYYFASFYPQQPDLNWDNPEVEREMLANMDFWADMGIDGFRLDAAPFLVKREGGTSNGLSETHAVIKRIRKHIEAKYPEVILLAEAHQSIALTKEYFGNSDECHMAYHFPLMEALWVELAGIHAGSVGHMVNESFDIPVRCQWAVFLRNHDEISLSTLDPDTRARLIAFFDPQSKYVFKKARATSMRIASIFENNPEKILQAIQLLYSTPGSHIMYYGDEIGMRNLPADPSIVDTRKFVRGQFDWDQAKRQMQDQNSTWNRIATMIRSIRSITD